MPRRIAVSSLLERDLRIRQIVAAFSFIAAIVIVTVIALMPGPTPAELAKQDADEKAAIKLVQSRYEPSLLLLSINPDLDTVDWGAVRAPEILCTYKNCWDVYFYVTTISGGKTMTVNANWFADPNTGQAAARDTEARMLFDAHLPELPTPASPAKIERPSATQFTPAVAETSVQTPTVHPEQSFDSEFSWYVADIRRTVSSNWYKQSIDPKTAQNSQTLVTFDVMRDGTPANIRIVKSSGSPSMDTECVRAVQRARFQPLPPAYEPASVGVSYTFTYDEASVVQPTQQAQPLQQVSAPPVQPIPVTPNPCANGGEC
jgi:TonB family protein